MVVYLFVVIQIYNKFSGFLLFFTIIYNLSLEMSDEPICNAMTKILADKSSFKQRSKVWAEQHDWNIVIEDFIRILPPTKA